MKTGNLYWITGLSGAGKTTLAKLLYQEISQKKSNVVLLDGDDLRKVYGLKGHYTGLDRMNMAMRHARMCHLLTMQNIDVICATISMFDQVRKWNKDNNQNYCEILLQVDEQTLIRRNKIYSNEGYNQNCQLVGLDIKAELPESPDLVLVNDEDGIESIFYQLKQYLTGWGGYG